MKKQKSPGRVLAVGGPVYPARMGGMRRAALLALVAILGALPSCLSQGARLMGGYMSSKLTGTAGLTTGGVPVDADLEQDLGLGDGSDSIYLRAELDAGPIRVTGSAFQYSGSGSGTLTVDFGGVSAGAPVDTSIDFINLKGAATFDIDLGPLRVAPGVAVDLIDFNLDVTDTNTLANESIDELYPVPLIFLQGELDLGQLGAVLDIGYMDLSLGDLDGEFIDVEGYGYYEISRTFVVFAGYRWVSIEAEGQNNSGDNFRTDLELNGFTFGGGFYF